MNSGTVAFWVLAGSAILSFISVLLKLTWWRSTIGCWFFLVTATIAGLNFFIFTLQLDWWPKWIETQARAIIYSTMAIPFLLLTIDIWRKNRHHWSWSKDD